MTTSHRTSLILAGLMGASGVALGALGAHALAADLAARGRTIAWETAARYHLYHSLALLAVAIWQHVGARAANRAATWAVRCWTGGILLFSGSLYWLALGGPRWLGPVTPLGGIALMAGWLFVFAAAWSRDDRK